MTGSPRDADRVAAELEPTAHVVDGPAEYRVEIDAPGLGADDFDVQVEGRLLHVRGVDLRRPGSDATFEFVFRLPDQVAGDDLEAVFDGGRLVVGAPAREARPRRLEVRTPKTPREER